MLVLLDLPDAEAQDALRAALALRTTAKVDTSLKTKGRLIVDFKTPAQAQAALAAVLAVPQ